MHRLNMASGDVGLAGPPFDAPGAKAPPPGMDSFLDLAQNREFGGDVGVDPSHMEQGEALPDKQTLCIDILVKGYVNSYVDFFYLTHRSEEDAGTRTAIPDDRLAYIKHQLTVAEKAHRR